jgi:hypothetical protein
MTAFEFFSVAPAFVLGLGLDPNEVVLESSR